MRERNLLISTCFALVSLFGCSAENLPLDPNDPNANQPPLDTQIHLEPDQTWKSNFNARDISWRFLSSTPLDNSIEAGASVIDIQMHLEQDGKPAVSIADDGCGMDRDGLLHAMRFGAAAVDDPSRLGRFGLGLKAASFGFCRRLSGDRVWGDYRHYGW